MNLTAEIKCPITSYRKGGDDSALGDLAEAIMKGSILCQRCGRRRRERVCPSCGYDSCLIRIPVDGKYKRLYHGKEGKAYSYKDAFVALSQINTEIEQGVFDLRNWHKPEIEKRKFQYLWLTWMEQKQRDAEKGVFSFETLRIYKSYYRNHYLPFYDLDVREIKLKHLQTFVNDLNVSEKFTKNLVDCVKTFFQWLKKWGDLNELPIFPETKVTSGERQRAISYEQQLEAINNIPEEHRSIFAFMRECGLRVSEVCAIKISDLDISNHSVLIQRTYSGSRLVETTKGRKREWVPLSEVAQGMAEALSKDRFGEEFLFLNTETGKGYHAASLRYYWRKYSGQDVCVHEGIRHSTISDWSRRANAFQVRELARHSDIKTSQRYVHNALTDLRDIVNRDNVISIRSDSNPIRAKRGK